MIKKTLLFFGGYLLLIFAIYMLNNIDETAPSSFGKWLLYATPVYILLFFLLNYLITRKGKGVKDKVILLVLMFCTSSNCTVAQDNPVEMLSGFSNLTEGFEKLINTFSRVDNNINKTRATKMRDELLASVGDLVIVKQLILAKLEDTANKKPDFRNNLSALQDNLGKVAHTLLKYEDLVIAAGINTQKLANEIKSDYFMKVNTLEEAEHAFKSGSLEKARSTLIAYFKICITLLKNSQSILLKFVP